MKKVLTLMLAALMLLLCCTAYAEPYAGEEVTLRVFGWETYADVDWNTPFGQWFQEQLGNVKIEAEIAATDSQTLLDLYLISGDDMPDIIMYRNPQDYLDVYGDSGRLLDLNDYAEYMPEYQARRELFAHLSQYDSEDGETFLLMPVRPDYASEVWFQNDALMEKYGLETPKTWDDMKNCLEVVCAGEGWDGTNAMPIALINWGFTYDYGQFGTIFGHRENPKRVMWSEEKGEWVQSLTEYNDVHKEIVTAMAEAYANGWIHKDQFVIDAATYDAYLQNGQCLFMNRYLDSAVQTEEWSFNEYSYIVSPVGGSNTKPYVCADYTSDATGWCYGISSTCKNPEVAAQFLELISSEKVAKALVWGVEGVTYTVDENGAYAYTEEYLSDKAADATAAAAKYGIGGTSYYWQPFSSTYLTFDAMVGGWSENVQAAMRDAQAGLASGEYMMQYYARTPNFDELTIEDISAITSPLGTYITEGIQNFVVGQKDLSEWDSFMEGMADMGDLDWVLEQYNTAEQYPMTAMQADRVYPQVP